MGSLLLSLLFLLAGFAGGFLAGLLGVGGGILFIFVFAIYFSSQGISEIELPRYLIANSIFATFFAGLSGSIRHFLKGSFYPKEVVLTAIPGLISALLIAWSITRFEWYNQQMFTAIFLVMVLIFIWRMFFYSGSNLSREGGQRWFSYPLTGFFAGIVSALSGLGGGVVMIPVMSELFKVPIKKAASISLGVIPVFALGMSLYFLFSETAMANGSESSYIVLSVSLPLAIGVIIGGPTGVGMASRLPARVIKIIFALVLCIVALKMLWQLI